MTTTNFTINPTPVGPSGVTSPGQAIPAGLVGVNVQFSCATWSTSTGTLSYRVDIMLNGVWTDIDHASNIVIGSLDRHGLQPHFYIGGDAFAGATQVRLFISSTNTINIGATITVTTNP